MSKLQTSALVMAAIALTGLAACDRTTDDVVRAPAPDLAPERVTRAEAKTATTEAAVALGMTRKELEDADLISPAGVDLGDVEHLVTDSTGSVTHLVIELDGPGDLEVLLPLAQVKAENRTDGRRKNLVTDLSSTDLANLPRYIPAR